MRRATIAVTALFVASLVWAALLATRSPWVEGSGALVGVSMVVLTAISVVGILVAGARWGRRLLVGTVAVGAVLAVTVDIDALWVVAMILSGYGVAEASGSGLRDVVGKLRSASGPPAEATVIPLLAIGYAAALGLVQPDGVVWSDWLAAAGVAAIGFAYAKAAPLSVAGVRLVVPLFIPVSLWLAGFPGGLGPALVAGAITALAWTKNARVAVNPLVTGKAVRIPPELTPTEILDAAGLDERGRQR